MTGAVIMAYDPSQVADGAQVTVVTGTQFAVNAPSTPAEWYLHTRRPRPRRRPPRPRRRIAAPSPVNLEPRTLGSAGVPGRRYPDRARAQPDLTGHHHAGV